MRNSFQILLQHIPAEVEGEIVFFGYAEVGRLPERRIAGGWRFRLRQPARK